MLLDFYADWCVSCKEMERFTFTDPQVQARFGKLLLLQADTAQACSPRFEDDTLDTGLRQMVCAKCTGDTTTNNSHVDFYVGVQWSMWRLDPVTDEPEGYAAM